MSRSNNVELRNPAVKRFEWSGDNGNFRYYDKEKKERFESPLPFRFMVLDCLSTIGGYSDADKSGYWSNEIRNLKTEPLTVRNKNGVCAEGIYNSVITSRAIVGAKYIQSVYIAFHDEGEVKIGNVQMKGAALGAWIDFRKKAKIYEGAIEVKESIEGRKGKTVYQIPVFNMIEVKPESDVRATELDKELQIYLSAYLASNGEKASQQVVESHTEAVNDVDTVPVGDEPFDDGLPF